MLDQQTKQLRLSGEGVARSAAGWRGAAGASSWTGPIFPADEQRRLASTDRYATSAAPREGTA